MTEYDTQRKASIADPMAKLGHARDHLDLLDAAAKAYIEDPASFDYKAVPQPDGSMVSRAQRLVPPPVKLALICGDAVHNMRASLDYLVRQLGIADSKKVSDKSEFPVVKDAGEDEQTWLSTAGRTLKLLSPEHVSQIRLLQPFVDDTNDSPNVMLLVLDWLENIDKHNLPLIITAAATGTEGTAHGTRPAQLGIQWLAKMPVVIGDEPVDIYRMRATGPAQHIKIDQVTPLTLRFASDEGPTVRDLRRLADMVGGVIGSFAIDLL